MDDGDVAAEIAGVVRPPGRRRGRDDARIEQVVDLQDTVRRQPREILGERLGGDQVRGCQRAGTVRDS
jgi:hypothetical protein